MAAFAVAGRKSVASNQGGRKVSTSSHTYAVASGKAPSKIPTKKPTNLKGKATAMFKNAGRG